MSDKENETWFVIWCPQSSKAITRKFTSMGKVVAVRNKLKEIFPEREFHVLLNMPESLLKYINPTVGEESSEH